MINFSKLGANSSNAIIEPRDIFMSLPSKCEQYEYPRDVQSEVWKRWFEKRDQKNSIIKMNTGSGKTVVGLIILKSCLNEGKGPAVYVVPDNYLVQQVITESTRLGIRAVEDEDDFDFITNKAILVINIHKLVNGKSVFGMRKNNNIDVGSILIDDVHACLGTIDTQFTISIPVVNPLYENVIDILKTGLMSYSDQKYQQIVELQDPVSNMLVPFWIWQSNIQELRKLFFCNSDNNVLKFNYPLIKNCMETCNCVITSKCIEITPKCIPIAKISSFENAKQRIFMSATLADDSVFVTAMGLKSNEINNVITPEKADDIGDRLLIFPQVINNKITDEEIKQKLKSLSNVHNVVIIVPSKLRSEFWKDVADLLLDTKNINDGVTKLKSGHVGLVVFINKYDGVDLPNDACRILVIDGLPNLRSEYDTYVQNVNPSNKRILSEQIQKVEQGMGRGVRSNNDYCVAVLMGKGLSDIIIRAEGYKYFSNATQVQYNLSKQVWDELRQNSIQNIDKIFDLTDYSLKVPRNVEWIKASKDALASVKYNSIPNVDETSFSLREAFELSEIHQYSEAVKAIERAKNNTNDASTKGFLMQVMADYLNFINESEAQQILLSAIHYNKGLLRPIKGIQYQKLINKTGNQAQSIVTYINENNLNPNSYILKINALLESLQFCQDAAKNFELALKEISFMLGIVSSRPELERGKGPDNLWALGNNSYLVIECKNRTTTNVINKHDCNQLNGSIVWFENEYNGNNFTCCPIMIHNSNVFDYECSPTNSIRIITPEYLKKFRDRISDFSQELVASNNYGNATQIQKLLQQFNLLGEMIFNEYSIEYRMK